MKPEELLSVLHTANRLKDTTRHCWTPGNRHESVADHSWRLALTAFFLRDEFPETDMDKVIKMCLIHDLGECFTGDIPSFLKTDADTAKEDALLIQWVETLPQPYRAEMAALYAEMDALETPEAKLYKALDKLEAVIAHNESPISSWLPREYDLNLTYADEHVAFSPYLTALRAAIRRETEEIGKRRIKSFPAFAGKLFIHPLPPAAHRTASRTPPGSGPRHARWGTGRSRRRWPPAAP